MNTAEGTPVHFVDTTLEFAELCQQWRNRTSLAIDTEFVRTNTFYPKVGLIQIADLYGCYLIDPLAIEDWTEFKALLQDPEVTFVIHSCSEDLNLLHTSLGCLPRNLFDTQIAAAFLGLGFSLSYQALASQLLGKELDKGETRSDWLSRPLRETQLHYAANDVLHLLELQEILRVQLEQTDKLTWFESECSSVLDTAVKAEDPDNWQNHYSAVSNAWRLSESGLECLQKLCHWREVTARERDRPRNWIAKDADLLAIARHASEQDTITTAGLKTLSLSDGRFLSRYGSKLVDLLYNDHDEFVSIDRSLLNIPFKSAMRAKLKACQKGVALLAEELQMAPELLARKKILQDMVRDFDNNGELIWSGELAGWRRQVLESAFNEILPSQQSGMG